MEGLEPGDKLIKYRDDSSEMGAWIGKWDFEDKDGNEYTLCCDQDGGEWVED